MLSDLWSKFLQLYLILPYQVPLNLIHKHFSGGIFLKPMLMYDQGVLNIQTNGKTEICFFNHVNGSLIACWCGW